MTERVDYLTKYHHLAYDWGIHPPTLSGILIDALNQLVDEMLDDTPFDISTYHRDGRNDHQYIYDLIDGRIIERALTSWFANKKRKVVRCGSDADDKIVRTKGERITSVLDLIDLETGEKIDAQMSTEVRKEYHIKKNKGDRIIKEGGSVMFIILPTNEYFIVRKEELNRCELVYNPAWRKECYVIIPKQYYKMGGKNERED